MKPLYSNEKHHHARFTWVWNFQNICTIARTKSIHTNDTKYFVLFLLNLHIWVLNECAQEIFNCMLQFGSLVCVDYKREWMRLLLRRRLSSWKSHLSLTRDATWEATTYDREHHCWLKSTFLMIRAFRMWDKGKRGGTLEMVWLSL